MLSEKQLKDFKKCGNCEKCSMPDAGNVESWVETVLKCITKISAHFNIK